MPDQWDTVFRDESMLCNWMNVKLRKLQRQWRSAKLIGWEDFVEYVGAEEIEKLSPFRRELMRDAWVRMMTKGSPL